MISDEEILIEWNLGFSKTEIARKFSVQPHAIYKRLRKLSLIPHKKVEIINDKYIKCRSCDVIKEINQFGKRSGICNICRSERNKVRQNSNLDSNFKIRLGDVKHRCQENNIPFNLTFQDLVWQYILQEGFCFYTDIFMDINFGKGSKPTNGLSLDRLVPELGYVKENIVMCQYRVNAIKHDMTIEELKNWIPSWYNKIKKHLYKIYEMNRFQLELKNQTLNN